MKRQITPFLKKFYTECIRKTKTCPRWVSLRTKNLSLVRKKTSYRSWRSGHIGF